MTKSAAAKSPSYRWVVFSLLALGYLMVYFHRLCPAVVALDVMDDLKAGGTLMGLLASAYFYPYALMQIPAGLLSDSWGPRRTITVFFALAGVASLLFGFSQGVTSAIFWRVMVGLGVSMLFVPTMKVLTRWFKPEEFATMAGILMAVGGAGALVAATPLALLSNWLGWRGSFQAIGVITLVLALLIWLMVRDSPTELGLPAIDTQSGGPDKQKAMSLWQGVKVVLSTGRFWALAVWFFFTCAVFFSFGGLWGGPYLMHIHGLSKSQAGNVLSMLAWGMIVGSPILSRLSDKVFYSRKKVITSCSVGVLAMSLILAFFTASISVPMLYGLCFLLSVCSSAIVVVGFTTCKELFPVEIAGTSVGLVNLFPFMGGAVMQPVVGMVLESWGKGPAGYPAQAYSQAFMLFVACAVIALVAAFLIKETMPVKKQKA